MLDCSLCHQPHEVMFAFLRQEYYMKNPQTEPICLLCVFRNYIVPMLKAQDLAQVIAQIGAGKK